MAADSIVRRLRGAVGNAVVWGAAWSVLGVAAFATLKVAGILPASVHWLDSIMVVGRLGILGGIVGAAFSGMVGVLYRGRRLAEIDAVRFGVRGGIMAGLFVPAFFQAMNLLSGDGLVSMRFILDDVVLAAVFGGVAAGVSLKLAQRAVPLRSGASQDRPGLPGSGNPLAWAAEPESRRSHATARRV